MYCNVLIGVSPVEDIQYSFTTNNLLLITWTPPTFFSNDIPFDHSPASYEISVTDEDGDMLLDANIPNANVTVSNITECDTFNISITALLAQYTSITNTISNNGSK